MYEAALGKCIQEIYRRVCKMISDGETAKIKPFLKEFYGEQFESMSDEELTKNHQEKGIYAYQMKVGFFSKVDYNTVEKWMKDLNLTEDDRIFCPDLTIYEDKVNGLSACAPEEYKSEWGGDPHTYELGYLDNRCVTGNEYIMKLFHTASYSAKVTSEIMDTYEPILGKSRYREGGQNIGEMELWALMETGAEKFMQQGAPDMKTSQYIFLNELLLANYTLTDPNGIPLLSNIHSRNKALDDLDKLQ